MQNAFWGNKALGGAGILLQHPSRHCHCRSKKHERADQGELREHTMLIPDSHH